jgi:DNA-binding transcriptional MerR regulator
MIVDDVDLSEIADKFTRQEVMILADVTSNQLQYLERTELIKPERIWNNKKKPDVYYSWKELLQIKVIRNLRKVTSLQTIRKILGFFEAYHVEHKLMNEGRITINILETQRIAVINDEVFWIDEDGSDLGKTILNSKGIGVYKLLVMPTFQELVNEVWETAERSNLIDIKSKEQYHYH